MTPEVRPRAIQLNYPLGVGPFFLAEGGASLRRVPYSAVSAFRVGTTPPKARRPLSGRISDMGRTQHTTAFNVAFDPAHKDRRSSHRKTGREQGGTRVRRSNPARGSVRKHRSCVRPDGPGRDTTSRFRPFSKPLKFHDSRQKAPALITGLMAFLLQWWAVVWHSCGSHLSDIRRT